MTFQTWPIIFIIICALNISVFTRVKSYCGADKITKLPGQPNVSFLQYSGFITVDEKRNISYFYYFVEAESNPASKPLVLWLGGGSCSALGLGAFKEHGPFKTSGNILVKNIYSWNKVANMIYLESPVGVGFSYSEDKNLYVNDRFAVITNLNFLEKWLQKFPEFKNRELYLAGKEYAGHSVPQLANLIIQSKSDFINLRGIAIGNPYLEFSTDYNSQAEYLWSHGLISDSSLHQLTFVCNFSNIQLKLWTHGKLAGECARVNKQVSAEISSFISLDGVNLDVCSSSVSHILNQMQNEPKIDVCIEDEIKVYFNRKDVQKALHARLVGVENWDTCNGTYDSYEDFVAPTIDLLGLLVKSGIRVLVYSGDQDSEVTLTGTRKLVNGLAEKNLKLNTTQKYSPWFVGKQVAGWTQGYGDLLSYATIRGASGQASWTQPERSLVLFTFFLNGKPLPPVNDTI